MITFDSRDIRRLERDLSDFAASAVPHAVRNGMNAQAFAGKRLWGKEIRSEMVNRNRFTAGAAIQVQRATGLRVDSMEAVLGSIAPYMADQEFGATHRKQGKHGVPIPSSFSAGQAYKSTPRRRPIRKKNWLQNVRLENRSRGRANRARANLIAVKEAAASGRGYVYLETRPNRRGIYQVLGNPRRAKIRLVYDLSRESVDIPRTPTLAPTVDAVRKRAPALYRAAMIDQLKRRGLFR